MGCQLGSGIVVSSNLQVKQTVCDELNSSSSTADPDESIPSTGSVFQRDHGTQVEAGDLPRCCSVIDTPAVQIPAATVDITSSILLSPQSQPLGSVSVPHIQRSCRFFARSIQTRPALEHVFTDSFPQDGLLNLPVTSDQRSKQDEHPICKALPTRPCIFFIDSTAFDLVKQPWPRNQEFRSEFANFSFQRPAYDDLIVAVSHMWFFSKHPDPFGDEAQMCAHLINQAQALKEEGGKILVFYDFMSMTQPPFLPNQACRTKEEESAFSSALQAMPMIYLYADVVLLLESDVPQSHSDGSFGRRATTPACERGWIYLERFIAMVKVAMTREPDDTGAPLPPPVVLSNCPKLLQSILEGGEKLRAAAKQGKEKLKEAFKEHLEELERKVFSATSVDKQTNTGGIAGASEQCSDREVVASIMKRVVEQLLKHWKSMEDGELGFSYKNLVHDRASKAWQRARFILRWKRMLGGIAKAKTTEGPELVSEANDMTCQVYAVMDDFSQDASRISCYAISPSYVLPTACGYVSPC